MRLEDFGASRMTPQAAVQTVDGNDWVITCVSNWRALKHVWQNLERQAIASPFHANAWTASWYELAEASGTAEPLVVIGKYAGSETPTIVLALCRTKRRGLRIVCAADLGVSDYFKPLIPVDEGNKLPSGAFEDFVNLFPGALPPHDVLVLSRLDPSGLPTGVKVWPKHTIAKVPLGTWALNLTDPPDTEIQNRLTSKLRKSLRSKIRIMEEQAQRRVEHHWPLKDTRILDDILKMQKTRLREIGRTSAAFQEPWSNLYRSVISRGDPETYMAATVLFDGNAPVGGAIGMVSPKNFVALVQTFERGPADRFSPGTQVVYELMKKVKSQGIETFELSIGDQPYKKSFGCQRRPLYTIVVPRTLKGRLVWLAWRSRHVVRNAASKLLGYLSRRRRA